MTQMHVAALQQSFTDDIDTNQAVSDAARARHIPINAVDDPVRDCREPQQLERLHKVDEAARHLLQVTAPARRQHYTRVLAQGALELRAPSCALLILIQESEHPPSVRQAAIRRPTRDPQAAGGQSGQRRDDPAKTCVSHERLAGALVAGDGPLACGAGAAA